MPRFVIKEIKQMKGDIKGLKIGGMTRMSIIKFFVFHAMTSNGIIGEIASTYFFDNRQWACELCNSFFFLFFFCSKREKCYWNSVKGWQLPVRWIEHRGMVCGSNRTPSGASPQVHCCPGGFVFIFPLGNRFQTKKCLTFYTFISIFFLFLLSFNHSSRSICLDRDALIVSRIYHWSIAGRPAIIW